MSRYLDYILVLAKEVDRKFDNTNRETFYKLSLKAVCKAWKLGRKSKALEDVKRIYKEVAEVQSSGR